VTALLVVLGAAVGAPLRYAADRWISARTGSALPWGTFAVNTTACLALGAVAGLLPPDGAGVLVRTGLLGALSTYSTFGYETFRLLGTGRRIAATANAAGSVAAGMGAYLLGGALAAAVAAPLG
jgi:CrcB protein